VKAAESGSEPEGVLLLREEDDGDLVPSLRRSLLLRVREDLIEIVRGIIIIIWHFILEHWAHIGGTSSQQ